MRATYHLYAAYGITWAIHLGYIFYLVRRFTQVRAEAKQLARK